MSTSGDLLPDKNDWNAFVMVCDKIPNSALSVSLRLRCLGPAQLDGRGGGVTSQQAVEKPEGVG